MGESASAEKKYNLAYYCILYLDVLGQSHLLDQLEAIPRTQEEEARTIETIRQSIGFLLSLRDWTTGYFQEYDKKLESLTWLLGSQIDIRFFSDSIQFSVCLCDDGSEFSTQMNGVLDAIIAGCGMHLLSLFAGKATRGGIDVGLAMKLDTGEIYGASLARAVRLEQKNAQYPRIVVGAGLRDYLQWVQEQPFQTIRGEAARRSVQMAERLIFKDNDGEYALDFMGSEMKELSMGTFDSDAIDKVLSFVKQERDRFRSENDPKLADRYNRLWNYVTSRADIWGAVIPKGEDS